MRCRDHNLRKRNNESPKRTHGDTASYRFVLYTPELGMK
jgi:hypothetical protein